MSVYNRWRATTNEAKAAAAEMRLEEAERLFKLAVKDAEMFGVDPRLSSSLANLAELYRIDGRYAEGEELYLRSLQILERSVGKKHPLLGIALHNFASFLLDAGKLEEAQPLYERALQVKAGSIGEEHKEYAGTLYHLAELAKRRGDDRAAVKYLRQALSIVDGSAPQGWQTPQAAQRTSIAWRRSLVESLCKVGRSEEGVQLQQDALQRAEQDRAPRPLILMISEGLGEALWLAGHRTDAEVLIAKDLAALKGGEHPAFYAARLRHTAGLPGTLGKQASEYLQKAIEACHASSSSSCRNELLRSYLAYAELKETCKQKVDAKQAYQSALEVACALKKHKEIRHCESVMSQL